MATPEFPDKKPRQLSFDEVTSHLNEGRRINAEFNIGQKEATWAIHNEYPDLPAFILLMTDTHYGSIHSDNDKIIKHLAIVESTPNFYMVHNGDHTDNFLPDVFASGMTEDPVSPQITARAWAQRMRQMDGKSKIGALGYGNHDSFGFDSSAQDFYDTYFSDMQCPIMTTGGLIHIMVGAQRYDMAMMHRHWGSSRLNPTNVSKRILEHEYPTADIIFTGHTHQSEGLHFERAGIDRIACIGGTYKVDDPWAAAVGISHHAGSPGWVVALWPDCRKMQLFHDVAYARDTMMNCVDVLHPRRKR